MGSSRHEQAVGYLPLEINTMVGRRTESSDLRGLMGAHRLVTLTGPAGVGKTRTALHVARSARRTFPGGAWFVELGSVQDAVLVTQVVLETLKVPDASARDPRAVLADHLRGRLVLIVLDNCEHLSAEVAILVGGLLQKVPGVQFLATSLQPLGVPGEATYRIDPLPVPDEGAITEARDVSDFAAVELFATRARTALGEFEVDASNQRDVARLCARLEGLPLALELAASRLKVMTIDELLRRLDDRFGMLKGTSHFGPLRHQTLLTAVSWSHDLCTPAEQLLWRRASVFPGRFSLSAAEAVCAGGELPREQVLEALLGLIDKSVVINEEANGRMRFRMLGALRDFGAERLAETGETEGLRVAHCAWTSALLAEAAGEWFGPRQAEWTAELRLEQANIRAALDFSASHAEHARGGQQMAGASWFHWIAGEYLAEGRHWLELVLAADTRASPERALALGTTGYLSALQGDLERAVRAAAECEELALDLGDRTLVAYAVHMRALCAFFDNRASEAEALYGRSRTLYAQANAPEAWRLLQLFQYAVMHTLQGDLSTAADLYHDIETACEARSEQWILSYAVWGRGLISFHTGNYTEAEALLRRSIAMKRPFHDMLGFAVALDVLAWVLAAEAEPRRAARIVGAASRLWSTFGAELFSSDFFTLKRAECESAARQSLGDSIYEDEARQGAEATLDDILADLLDVRPAPTARTTRRTESVLTRREQEVAALVAEGLTNQEIATRLVISVRTAEAHVENVLRKLDFRSRTQIATWIAT